MSDCVQRVKNGEADWSWRPLLIDGKGRTLEIEVMPDAMKLDGIRFQVTAVQAQEIADAIGAILPTPRIEDHIFLKCNTFVAPVVRVHGRITALASSADYNALVDAQLARLAAMPDLGLICSVGKSWVLDNYVGRGAKYGIHTVVNYGWHAPNAPRPGTLPGTRVWQDVGWAHNDAHSDPSQVCRLVNRQAKLDGTPVDILNVLADAELHELLAHERLQTFRIPTVPEPPAGQPLVLPPTTVKG